MIIVGYQTSGASGFSQSCCSVRDNIQTIVRFPSIRLTIIYGTQLMDEASESVTDGYLTIVE